MPFWAGGRHRGPILRTRRDRPLAPCVHRSSVSPPGVYVATEVMYTEVVRRTQIYLDEDVDRTLRAVAAAEGRSAADLIREAVRRYLAERSEGGVVDPILAMIGTVDGLPSDAATEHDRDLYGETVGKGRRRR